MKVTIQELKAESYKRSFYKFSKEAFKVLHNCSELDENWHIEYLCKVLQKEAERIVKKEKKETNIYLLTYHRERLNQNLSMCSFQYICGV
jgi:hypothetical protein